MASNLDRRRFTNDDLVLRVRSDVPREVWDESRYAAFLEALCGSRDYQKEAIRTGLRYLLGGQYKTLHDLAKENFDANPTFEARYGTWAGMKRHLQLPDQLSANLDLATGTGKSYVLYGIAAILLAEGAVDRVLVLCPSTTIEQGLLEKFRALAADEELSSLLPDDAVTAIPSIINATETITSGSICIENYHAVLEHVGSSVRDSLRGSGSRVAVLNDEAHHIANESSTVTKKWKEFLIDPAFGFYYVIGLSGTPYVKDEYFADVIYRYSLRQAMEDRYVKRVDYVAEMPKTNDPDEKWQLIYGRHSTTRDRLAKKNLLPLSIIVTSTIKNATGVADDLKHFLTEHGHVSLEDIDDTVLVVHNKAPDLAKLPYVDSPSSKVEWIVSVSMLNEGWDVKRVFQIVPHEERAFNSKLLIAQVLGRGLRVPEGWQGEPPTVTIFNHDAWAPSIRHLVDEVLELERRVSARVVEDSPYHFTIDHAEYELASTTRESAMQSNYNLLEKGYVNLSSELAKEDVEVEFARAATGSTYKWQTQIQRKTYSPAEVARAMYARLEDAEAQDDEEGVERPEGTPTYTEQFPVERLVEIVRRSLTEINKDEITESMKQKFLSALGTLRRKASRSVRYTPKVGAFTSVSTIDRPADSVSVADARHRKTVFVTTQSRAQVADDQLEAYDEITETGNGFKVVPIANASDFKTPLNIVIADSDNEQRFIKGLVHEQNTGSFLAWIKSTASRFYEIAYSWRKGEHTRTGRFSPDFFIRVSDDLILVVEVKDDTELHDPSDENVKKNSHAQAHFDRLNAHLHKTGSPRRYQFHFLTPKNFNAFFQHLREGNIVGYRSELDVVLADRSGVGSGRN